MKITSKALGLAFIGFSLIGISASKKDFLSAVGSDFGGSTKFATEQFIEKVEKPINYLKGGYDYKEVDYQTKQVENDWLEIENDYWLEVKVK